MANNRMWLRCRGCGELLLLGKMYGTGYGAHYTNLSIVADEYYEQHDCCGNVHYENQFELVYDIARDKESKEEHGDKVFSRPFNYTGEVIK